MRLKVSFLPLRELGGAETEPTGALIFLPVQIYFKN